MRGRVKDLVPQSHSVAQRYLVTISHGKKGNYDGVHSGMRIQERIHGEIMKY